MSSSDASSPDDEVPGDVTRLLDELRDDRSEALAALLPLVYDELRELASRQMSGQRAGHTLATTALVHEAYLKLAGPDEVPWQDRAHLLAVASLAMRQVLINHARRISASKRGAGRLPVTLDDDLAAGRQDGLGIDELLDLDAALERLAERSARQAEVVTYRFFGGLTNEEIGEVLGVSVPTVVRDWRMARAWLVRELSGGES